MKISETNKAQQSPPGAKEQSSAEPRLPHQPQDAFQHTPPAGVSNNTPPPAPMPPGHKVRSAQFVLLTMQDAGLDKTTRLSPNQGVTLVLSQRPSTTCRWFFSANPVQPAAQLVERTQPKDHRGWPRIGAAEETYHYTWSAEQLATFGKKDFSIVANWGFSEDKAEPQYFHLIIAPDAV